MGCISLTVSPGAKRSEIVGRHGSGWRVRVAAPAEGGRANAALVELLASALGVPRSRVVLRHGRAGRRKLAEVDGLDDVEIERRLESLRADQLA